MVGWFLSQESIFCVKNRVDKKNPISKLGFSLVFFFQIWSCSEFDKKTLNLCLGVSQKIQLFFDRLYLGCLHPITWNLKITSLKRKIIFKIAIFGFHVNCQGCSPKKSRLNNIERICHGALALTFEHLERIDGQQPLPKCGGQGGHDKPIVLRHPILSRCEKKNGVQASKKDVQLQFIPENLWNPLFQREDEDMLFHLSNKWHHDTKTLWKSNTLWKLRWNSNKMEL